MHRTSGAGRPVYERAGPARREAEGSYSGQLGSHGSERGHLVSPRRLAPEHVGLAPRSMAAGIQV